MNKRKGDVSLPMIITIIGFVLVLALLIFSCRASLKRWIKSLGSEFNNGINRTVTVYDYNGNSIRSWSGKFDVTESETGIMFDDQNGKRTIITGGIIINEEK